MCLAKAIYRKLR